MASLKRQGFEVLPDFPDRAAVSSLLQVLPEIGPPQMAV
jgi:hypothetical protein